MARLAAWTARVRPWLARRTPWLLLLVAIALAYYGSYVRHGINFRDEGGTVALLSKRLLDGERPFLDVVLGYNVMWFYPVVGLFKLFGVNFVLLRAYCFALSTITAVLAFLTVERASRRPWLAFLVALLPVLVPGMTFKNYMPLLAVANSFCLLHFALGPRPSRQSAPVAEVSEFSGPSWKWLVIGGLVLGLTFLIRIDVGVFCFLLWTGALLLVALHGGRSIKQRLAFGLAGPVAVFALALLVHVPVYLDASHRGFAKPFVAAYQAWPKDLVRSLQERLGHAPPPAALPTPTPKLAGANAQPAAKTPAILEKETSWNRQGLARKTLWDLGRAKDAEEAALILLVYVPIIILFPLAAWAAVAVLLALRNREVEPFARPLAALLVIGGALTTFPQYFFFRPDAPHVSEFSPGYWVAAFSACCLLGFRVPQRWTSPARLATSVFLLALVLHAGLFLWRMMPDRWTGTIAARKGRNVLFHGANGVDVFVSKKENKALQEIRQIVEQHSPSTSDYLLAYPYHPALNLLCDRRAYEKNVYIDNATREPGWNAAAIRRIQKFQPKVIILSDWDINGSEESRFSIWAEPTKTWIQTHYINQGTYLEFDVFTRPEKIAPPL